MHSLTIRSCINIFLTGMLLTPILRAKVVHTRIRLAAVRTLVAFIIGLSVSAVNMAVLTALHGQELGALCLAFCSMDVVVNVLALFWITGTCTLSNAGSSAGTRDANEQHRERPNLKSLKSVVVSTMRTPHSPSSSVPSDELPLGSVRPGGAIGRFFGPSSEDRARVEISVTTQCKVEADVDSNFDTKSATDRLEPKEIKDLT